MSRYKKLCSSAPLFLLLALTPSFQSCEESSIDSQSTPKVNEMTDKSAAPGVSSETAVLIATGILCLDYELHDAVPKVETENELWKEYGEMWKVTFVYKPPPAGVYGGGNPVVWILKSNGERFTVKHAK